MESNLQTRGQQPQRHEGNVYEGKTSIEHKKGNDKADELADRGNEEHVGTLFLKVACWINKRHKGYTKFMAKIHHVIPAVLKKEKEGRRTRSKVKATVQGYDDEKEAMVTGNLIEHRLSSKVTQKRDFPPPIRGGRKLAKQQELLRKRTLFPPGGQAERNT